MNKAADASDFAIEGNENLPKCPQCGATTQLNYGTCINCFLREGLEAKGEASRETFESVLVEDDVTDTHWRLGHYEVLEEIGRGGMGVIYRARQQHSRRIVAVKRILAHQVSSHESLVRFRREAEAVASLDHPNILPIHEVSESEEGLPYFSMKYAAGGSLRTAAPALRNKPRECVRVMAKVARAMAYAHRKGILHRDLQPGNILLDENGEPMVSDFGLAKWLDETSDLTRTLETLGTPGYIAPEQTECPADKLTCAADVYSLGAILFYLLSGRPPFVGSNVLVVIHQAAATPAPRLRSLVPSLDRDLETIVGRCLESDPKARYQSAGALADDLEHWLRHEPIKARRSGLFVRGKKWLGRKPAIAALTASLIALAAVIGWIVWKTGFIRPPVTNGIAVLPFENLSGDPANAYFAEGIQEEILTRLAGIAALKVISRTSTQRYQNKPRNLSEIAKQLGVANILEGSVQKAADQVRVNVQLINAQTDSHLWAETYDRKLTDIFGVESEIAKGVAESLQSKLIGHEERTLAIKPTNNLEAYDAYLRGLSFEARSSPSLEAAGFYERAVQLDPNFVVAWARLSRADAHLYFDQSTTSTTRRDAAKRALENAQKLQPNSPETLLALGYYQYLILGDYEAAKTTFKQVSKMLPGNSEVPKVLGAIARREGHWDQSIAYYEQALALDPRNVELLMDTAWTYDMLRQFPKAIKLYDRVLDITPNNPDAMVAKADIYQAQGNLQEAAKFLSEINWQTSDWDTFQIKITQLRLERNYGEAVRLLQVRLAQFHFTSEYHKAVNQVVLALMQRLADDSAGAKAVAEQARNTLEPLYKNQLDNASVTATLSLANALLGETGLALPEADRARMLYPRSKDSMAGPALEENLALVQTILGEKGLAISALTRLLQTPYRGALYGSPVTPALLRLDPNWDPLRTDPAFQKLCEEKQPLESPWPLPAGIAVLPFENLSAEPDNAFFADGMQDEILNDLAKIADLKVISRTSVMQYKTGEKRNLRQIANELGVPHVVEGSVQRDANRVRVSARLIDAKTDTHLLVKSYDRPLGDVFAIQSDIAKNIADALQVKLTTGEKQALAAKPTNNLEAYELYLRGLSFEARFLSALKAAGFYEQAVQLDPNFAPAWARLSRADADIYSDRRDTTPGRRDAAKRALENAQRLEPNSPETLLALGYYQYRVLRDYGAAKTTFGHVSKMLPSSTEVPYALAEVTRREGNWDQSIAYYGQALALDPRNVEIVREAALTYSIVRRFPAALKLYDRALDITPNDPELMAFKARIYQAQGNLQEAGRFLSEINWQTPSEDTMITKLTQLRLERNYGEAIQFLQARQDQFHFSSGYAKVREQLWLASTQRLAGDAAGAKATAEQARNALELVCKDHPVDAFAWATLAQANALIGEKDLALKQTTHAMTLLSSARDPMIGPAIEVYLAEIQTIFGETSRPISTLARLLQTPAFMPVTPALLRLNPNWDPLRTDPAFQKLCEEKQPLESPWPLPARIAVLPFENLSAEPDNAFFADGMQDEILNDLAKIANLKVISRTSVMQYRSGVKRNLRQIANELSVAHVVEGSVQRDANRVRVSARLIDAKTDTHLLVKSYDRPLGDVFAIQSDIAKNIADALQVKLTTGEKQALAAKPTNNLEAYDLYLRGLSFEARSTSLWEAAGFYEQAVQLDPNFAPAWARLSRANADIYFDQRDTTPGRRDAAKRALENAQKLEPNSPETLLALGYYQYRVLRDYGAAKTTFGYVSKMLPSSTEVPYAFAEVTRREGNWDQSIAYFEQALALDPRNVELLRDAALTYSLLRQFPAALKLYDRALDIMPNDPEAMAEKARIHQAQGNLQEAARFLSGIDWQSPHEDTVTTKLNQLRLERNYGETIQFLQARQAQFHFSSQYVKIREQVTLAFMQRLAGDTAGAKATAEQARNALELVCKDQPDNAFAWATLGRANALLGERDLALTQVTRSMTILPSAKDPMLGPALEQNLPVIQTIFGETSRPIATLARLLQTPSYAPLTPALLRLDPVWDPLRTDPAFHKLCEEKQL